MSKKFDEWLGGDDSAWYKFHTDSCPPSNFHAHNEFLISCRNSNMGTDQNHTPCSHTADDTGGFNKAGDIEKRR